MPRIKPGTLGLRACMISTDLQPSLKFILSFAGPIFILGYLETQIQVFQSEKWLFFGAKTDRYKVRSRKKGQPQKFIAAKMTFYDQHLIYFCNFFENDEKCSFLIKTWGGKPKVEFLISTTVGFTTEPLCQKELILFSIHLRNENGLKVFFIHSCFLLLHWLACG